MCVCISLMNMYMHTNMYICKYMRIHVLLWFCLFVCVSSCLCVCPEALNVFEGALELLKSEDKSMYVCMYVSICVYIIYIISQSPHTCILYDVYIYIYIMMCVYICIYLFPFFLCVNMYCPKSCAHMYVYMCIYIHTYIFLYFYFSAC